MVNIVLLLLVFGANKKKVSPYLSALILCVIKTALYYGTSHHLLGSLLAGVIFAPFAFAFVFLLQRIEQKEPAGATYGSPGAKRRSRFIWEYIPISVILALLIFGDALAPFFKSDLPR